MTVKITKPEINVREKLNELDYGRVPYHKMPAGSVVQVVDKNYTHGHVTTTSATFVNMGSPFNLSISPKFSNSKILIDVMLNPYVSGGESGVYNIHNGTGFLTSLPNAYGYVPGRVSGGSFGKFHILTSEDVSSTETITYQIYFKSSSTSTSFYGHHNNHLNGFRLTEIAQ